MPNPPPAQTVVELVQFAVKLVFVIFVVDKLKDDGVETKDGP